MKEPLGVPDSYAIAAVMPLGKPTRQLTKLKRRSGREITVHNRFGVEPLGPHFESIWLRTQFALATHE